VYVILIIVLAVVTASGEGDATGGIWGEKKA
jgi:hypothetical protein